MSQRRRDSRGRLQMFYGWEETIPGEKEDPFYDKRQVALLGEGSRLRRPWKDDEHPDDDDL